MPTDDTPTPTEYYDQLDPLTETVESLQETAVYDGDLDTEERAAVRRTLFTINRTLEMAREILPNPDPATDATLETDEWDEYSEAIRQIERRLKHLHQLAEHEHPDEYRESKSPAAKFSTALEGISILRDHLPGVDPDGTVEVDIVDLNTQTPYDHVPGRGHGKGQWLEYQLERAFRRWGYTADTRQKVFDLEVDVVATRNKKQGDPTDWLVAQCKDWESKTITPRDIYRLCTVAFTCRAMPVLCHTTDLTTRAEQFTRHFEIRVLELEDLERGELPAPKVARPSAELFEYSPEWTAREERGNLPLMFRREPGKRFSYVPGFEPAGKGCAYEPIDDPDDRDDDPHPAAGH